MSAGRGAIATLSHWAQAVVCGVAFWVAILLPLAYLPLLVAGVPRVHDPDVLGTLVTVNVVALVLGHFYDGIAAQRLERS